MKSYGPLIERARLAAGLNPEELGEKLSRKKGIVYRMERGEQEPTADQINILVANLALSAEDILLAMGVNFNPPEARRIPNRLVQILLQMGPEGCEGLLRALDQVQAFQARPR